MLFNLVHFIKKLKKETIQSKRLANPFSLPHCPKIKRNFRMKTNSLFRTEHILHIYA